MSFEGMDFKLLLLNLFVKSVNLNVVVIPLLLFLRDLFFYLVLLIIDNMFKGFYLLA
jgi:hypothetical protein